jgi:hypothetical protein
LSYTTFDRTVNGVCGLEEISIEVANTGGMAGKETVLLYAHFSGGKLEQPEKRFVAFAKTRLLFPGERETLTLTIDENRLSSYDEARAAWVIEAGAHITSPLLFAKVNGTVQIRGSASGADFTSYRLEFGQGLNPQTWTQIGTNPVNEDILGSWEPSGLRGLYILRRLVVRTDRRVEQAVVAVMVREK